MRLLRPAALLTVLGLAAAGAVTLAPNATAASAVDAPALATYLKSQLVDGNHYETVFPGLPPSVDVGLNLDFALALAATGRDNASVQAIASYLDSETGRDYAEYQGDAQNLVSGAAAKLAVLAEVAHRDPANYAQLNLVAILADNVCTAAQVTSDPDECAGVGNYVRATSVFSQALGVIAQQRVGTVDPTAVTYLLSLQRPDGAFPSLIPNSNDSDPDSTALAVQALAIVPDSDGSIAAAITKAVGFLVATQHSNGSWGPSFDPTSSSVNSTGVVLQALQVNAVVASEQAAGIAKAQAFMAGVQNASDGGLPAYGPPSQTDSDVRASTQGLGGILGVPFGTLSSSTPVTRTATTNPAATKAATYAVSQLTTGDHWEQLFVTQGQPTTSFVQTGPTLDLALGLLATGGHDVTLGKVLDYTSLSTTLRSYVNGENFGDTDSIYVGATAKLATVLQLAGRNPRDVGENHLDLIANLQSRVGAEGRISDKSSFGDNANLLGQSFAVLALTAAGDTADATKTRDALLAVQCSDGGFPAKFPANGEDCVSDLDTTGLAVQAINAAAPGTTATAASTSLVNAVAFLTGKQAANGSYGTPASTNTTAYAALGLLAVGQDAAAPRAYLTGIAQADGGLPVAATGSSDFLATAQSLPVLAGVSFLQVSPRVIAAASTVAAPTPPTTTPPTTTPPTTTSPGSPTAGAPSTGASGQGGGTELGDGGGSLPNTGADVIGPLWLGVLALLMGAGATAWGVRRPRVTAHGGRRH